MRLLASRRVNIPPRISSSRLCPYVERGDHLVALNKTTVLLFFELMTRLPPSMLSSQ